MLALGWVLGIAWFAWVVGDSERLELADGMGADMGEKEEAMEMDGYALEGIRACLPLATDLDFYLDGFVDVL